MDGGGLVKILLVNPGVNWSPGDCWTGLKWGLEQCGVEVVEYDLMSRIVRHRMFLQWMWEASGAKKEYEPTAADGLYLASQGVLERALRHDVDWILYVAGIYMHPDFLMLCKRACLRQAIFLTECPYDDERQSTLARLSDVVFVNERASVARLRRKNLRVHYLQHAYLPTIHTPEVPILAKTPHHDVVFVGTCWADRRVLLNKIDWSGIDLGLYGSWTTNENEPIYPFVKGDITENENTASLYKAAKMSLNWHRRTKGFSVMHDAEKLDVPAESLNPRAYELAACECFHVSDERPELSEIFGDLVPTFGSAEELQELLRRWLPDDVGRQKRAREIREAVLPHTWAVRAEGVVASLRAANKFA